MSTLKLKNGVSTKTEQHPFHIVDASPLPMFMSIAIVLGLMHVAFLSHPDFPIAEQGVLLAKITSGWMNPVATLGWFATFLFLIAFWGQKVSDESIGGHHTRKVQNGLRLGFILFILSEVMFFFSVFWTLIHLASMPSVHIGAIWPPHGINVIPWWKIPLLNTVVLLSSGVFTVWAHRALIAGYKKDALQAILGACLLGLYFSWLQFLEYSLTDFSINDSAYGSIFFFGTGFHGMHVLVGTVLLWTAYYRIAQGWVSRDRFLGFEFAAWYWHFVDVVWLLLYILLYIWAGT
jgi:cytochrome c oxidase subunit 3